MCSQGQLWRLNLGYDLLGQHIGSWASGAKGLDSGGREWRIPRGADMMAAAVASTTVANGTEVAASSSEDEFFDAPSDFVTALPRRYMRVRNPDDAENAPDTELSIIKLAREVLGSVKAGADVTNVNLPASILDPVSTLEKTTKSMQRGDLLPDICNASDPIERLLAVLRFNLSGLAKEKFGKKPYNPVLGEVFRCCFAHRRRDHGTTVLVAEQVSHHPPITALHLHNRALGIRLNSHTAPEPRFWGNSLEVKLKGCIRITLDCHGGEEYLLTRPVVNMTGFLAGRQRLEFSGPATIVCEKSGLNADLEFKARGIMGRGEQHAISGRVYNARGTEIFYTFDGYWDNVVNLTDMRTGAVRELFNYESVKQNKSMLPVLPAEDELEELFSTRVWAECSDAIWRGNTIDANGAKRRVEDAQRQKKKEREANGVEWAHHYFIKRSDGAEGYLLREDVGQLLDPEITLDGESLIALKNAHFDELDDQFIEHIDKPDAENPGKGKKSRRRRLGALARGRKG